MSEALDFLDKSECDDEIFMGQQDDGSESDHQLSASNLQFRSRPVSARYAALEALDKSIGKLSFSMLSALWHLKSAEDAEELALMFANVGLGRVERRGQGDEEDVFVLHDLQYDFCTGAARKLSVNGHHLLLSGCIPWSGTGKDWESFCFPQNRSDGVDSSTANRSNSLRLHIGSKFVSPFVESVCSC